MITTFINLLVWPTIFVMKGSICLLFLDEFRLYYIQRRRSRFSETRSPVSEREWGWTDRALFIYLFQCLLYRRALFYIIAELQFEGIRNVQEFVLVPHDFGGASAETLHNRYANC